MPGGVGGAAPRGAPLSRSWADFAPSLATPLGPLPRPIEASKAADRWVRNTSTPTVRGAKTPSRDGVDGDKPTNGSWAPEPRHRVRSTLCIWVGFDRWSLASYMISADRRSEWPWLL